MHTGSEVSILIAFSAGVLTFISPCILPLFPSYITYITGRSFDDIKATNAPGIRKLTAIHSLFFILGFSIIFALLGISISYLGSFFGIKKLWLERTGGLLIILLGLDITGIINIGFLKQEKRVIAQRKKFGYIGSLFIGMAFAVGWTPCAGPILSSILIYASTLESMPKAVMLLGAYCIGLGLPFFISAIAINQFLFIFKKFKVVMKFVPLITGMFLVFIGVLLFTGIFSKLAGILRF